MFTKLFMIYLSCYSYTNELRERIFSNYSSDDFYGNKVDLKLGLAIRSLNNIDHVDGNLETNIWLRYYWNDKRLFWNESDYEQSSLIVNTHPEMEKRIWIPDIYIYNTGEKPLDQLSYTSAIVYSSGDIIWSRPGIVKSTCLFNLKNFPYDKQTCYFKFGSWSHSGDMINLTAENQIDITNFKQGEEWKIINNHVELEIKKYDCCPEPYHAVYFLIEMERMSTYYVRNIIVPIFATSSLLVISMIIPWESGERISFTTSIMLSIIVFLLILSDNLPKTNDVPIMSTLVIGLMFYSLAVVFITVILSSMRNIKNEENIFTKYIFKTIAKLLSLYRTRKTDGRERRRTISYDQALNEIVDNELNQICKKYSIYIEHGATFIFTLVFIIYCLIAMFIV